MGRYVCRIADGRWVGELKSFVFRNPRFDIFFSPVGFDESLLFVA